MCAEKLRFTKAPPAVTLVTFDFVSADLAKWLSKNNMMLLPGRH
jgi:hypothetical protein